MACILRPSWWRGPCIERGAGVETPIKLQLKVFFNKLLDVRADRLPAAGRVAITKAAKKRWAKVRKKAKKVA